MQIGELASWQVAAMEVLGSATIVWFEESPATLASVSVSLMSSGSPRRATHPDPVLPPGPQIRVVLEGPDEHDRRRRQVEVLEQGAQRPRGALASEKHRVLFARTNRMSDNVPGLVPATK
jgi:hypothetical protein